MILKKITISNYRGINGTVTVDFDMFNCIVGQNDAGKSTILKAIDLALNETKLTRSDYNVQSAENQISVELLFDCQNTQHYLGEEILTRFNTRRLQERIRIHALWPHGSKQKNDYIWNGKDDLTERRHAPKDVPFRMGYTIYGDKVSFISSSREVFGFIVQSKDFAELMCSQFKVMWSLSK